MSTDRIEKRMVMQAPRARVWRAVSDAGEFGSWFGFQLNEPFTPGTHVTGRVINPPGYEHMTVELWVEQVEPEHLFSFRWHPYGVDPNVDYSQEPTTLVEFRLAEVAGGTEVTIVESGFDRIPLERRAEAFRMNDQGWGIQIENLARNVTTESGVA